MAPIELTEDLCTKPIEGLDDLLEFDSKRVKVKKGERINPAFGKLKRKLNGEFRDSPLCPKVMVCHDFKGGYGDDRFCDGCSNPQNYYFRHWLQTDVFVYFAHKFVTIPPVCWINAAHSHGVTILGTIITEWNDGFIICESLLKDSFMIEIYVEKLCDVNEAYGFDGFLINIENKIPEENIPKLLEFIRKLTKGLKERSATNSVIWYDSVIKNGELKWQDELNDLNKIFFDECDGIYLNYNWNDEKLTNSKIIATPERKFDVYVGIDVFGRGCFGGGGFNTSKAVEKIASHDMSMAIFAPGWSFESQLYKDFCKADELLWILCAEYFFFKAFKTSEVVTNSLISISNSFKSIFETDFSRGFGENFYIFGKSLVIEWFNLSFLSSQPFIRSLDAIFIGPPPVENSVVSVEPNEEKCPPIPPPPDSSMDNFDITELVSFQTNCGFFSGGSLNVNKNTIENLILWIPIELDSKPEISLALLIIWKAEGVDFVPSFFVEKRKEDSVEKLYFKNQIPLDDIRASFPKNLLLSKLGSLIAKECKSESINNVKLNSEMNGWQIRLMMENIELGENEELTALKLHSSPSDQFSLGQLCLYNVCI